jgi:hypothetical protein
LADQRTEKSAPRKLYGHTVSKQKDYHHSHERSYHRRPSVAVIDNETLHREISQERRSKSRTKEFHYPVVGDFYEKKKQLEQSMIKQQL